MRLVSSLGAVLIPFLLATTSARAYVPPSEFILKGLIKKHQGIRNIRVRSLVTVMEADKPGQLRFRDLTTFYPESRKLRMVALSETDSHELFSVERKGSLSPVATVLFDNQYRNAVSTLKAAGIPIRTEQELLALETEEARRGAETLSLGRTGPGEISWVIGERKKGSPELWVEKDTFLPTRLIFQNPTSDAIDEVRFEKYRFVKEYPFPRLLTLYGDSQAALQAELSDIQLNAEISEPKVPLEEEGFTAEGKALPKATRELIRRFYESLR